MSHVIENGTISPNPAKIAAVKNIKPPRNVKQLQSFIGFCSYYRKYVKNFSSIVSPLLKLTEKRVEFIWTELHQNAFDQLKSYLISTDHVLALPDFDKPFRIECDASKIGISGVISQKHGCHYKPIAFYSKHLSKTERAYSTSERELLGIVLSVEHFKQYIYGRHVEIWTDHEPLKFLSTADVPSPRLARLQKRLNIYNYSIQYRPGKANGNADALSRLVEEDENEIDDHETDATILINAMFLRDDDPKNDQLSDPNLNWFIELKRENINRPFIKDFENSECKSLYKQWHRFKLFNNKLFREFITEDDNIIYQYTVPSKERETIIKNNHDFTMCGHLGFQKTFDRITAKYYWYQQATQIKQYVEECQECQMNKHTNKYNITHMRPIFATRPGQIVSADICGPLPTTDNDHKYILVVSDHFTKYVEFFSMKTQTAKETAQKLIQYISRHSCPESFLSDQGKNFQSDLLSELWEIFDIHKLRTTPYKPSTNGQTERINRTLAAMLTNYVNEEKNNWDEFLPLVQLAYNSAVHQSTKYSPFVLHYGRQPKLPYDLMSHETSLDFYLSVDSYAAEVQRQIANAYATVKSNIEVAADINKIRHDRNVRAAIFKLNDYVWLLDTAKLKGVSKKLSHKFKGPYQIVAVIDEANYKIRILNGKKSQIVNKCRLKRCFERRILRDKEKMEIQPEDDTITTPNPSTKTKTNSSKMNAKSSKTKAPNKSTETSPLLTPPIVHKTHKKPRKCQRKVTYQS